MYDARLSNVALKCKLRHYGVGDPEKLTKFLDLNPSVPRDRSFVDDSRTFDAYLVRLPTLLHTHHPQPHTHRQRDCLPP